MIHRYLDKRKQRCLTRSLSVDSGLIPPSGDRTFEETELKPGPYTAFVKRRLASSLSDASYATVLAGGVANLSHAAKEKGIQDTRRVDFADDAKEQSRTSWSNRTLRKRQSNQRLLCRPKVQHSCLSDAIEYKLEMREKERRLYQRSGEPCN